MNSGLTVTYRVFRFNEGEAVPFTEPVYRLAWGYESHPFGVYDSPEEAQAAIVEANHSDTFVILPVYVFKAVPESRGK